VLIEEALVAYLTTHPGLSALIGTRLYPRPLPQRPTLPAVTYFRVSGPRDLAHDGPVGLAHPRFQFDCWGADTLAAIQTANQLRLALDGFSGLMGGVGGVEVHLAEVVGDHDDPSPAPDPARARRIVDVKITHEEEVA
jgi:hypothetical protein